MFKFLIFLAVLFAVAVAAYFWFFPNLAPANGWHPVSEPEPPAKPL